MKNAIDSILIETVARRTGLNHTTIRTVLEAFAAIGWELAKKRSHRDVDLPNVKGIPSVLEGDH